MSVSTGQPPPSPSLVGREREHAALRDLLAAAISGRGGLALIGGEAGIGKTTLAEALCNEAIPHGALVLTGRCFDLTETPPYGPWLYLFARYHATGSLPLLPAVFAQPGVVGETASQAAIFNAVLDFFRAVSASRPEGTRPLVVLLDDLHWADLASLDLFRFLAQSVGTLPLLLIGTYRADELTRRHPLYALLPTLVRESHAVRLDVRRLTDGDVQAVVAAQYPLPEMETVRLVAYLQKRAEGNPFFLGELLRTLAEEGTLLQAEDGWHLRDMTRVGIPMLLQQVIDGRVGRLGEETKGLLTVAAVVGQEVPIALWATVAGADEERLLAVVETAIAAHLLEATPDGMRVRFAHALVRETLYEGILPPRRRWLHRAVAEALTGERNPDPDEVANHFRRAGDVRAAAWLALAGALAGRAFSPRTAADRLETALALCDAHDLDASLRFFVAFNLGRAYRGIDPLRAMHYCAEAMRLAERLGGHKLTALVLILRAWLRYDAQQTQMGVADYRAARSIVEGLTPKERDPISIAPTAEILALFESDLAGHLAYFEGDFTEYLALSGHFTEARAVGERFVADASVDARALPRHYQVALGDAYNGLHLSYFAQGEPERAARAAADALRCYDAAQWDMMSGNLTRWELLRLLTYYTDRVGERRHLADMQDAFHARFLATLGTADPHLGQVPVLALEGGWAEAGAILRRVPGGIGHGYWRFAGATFGALARAQGDTEAAWSVVRATLPDGPTAEINSHFWLHTPALLLGAGLTLDAGDLPAARSWLEMHDALLAQSEAVLGLSEGETLWAQYYQQAGDMTQAYAHAERALAHATVPRQPLALLAAHRRLGELDTETGRYDDAARHLDASLALADACAAPYERALTLLLMAVHRAACGQTHESRTLLDAVRAICMPLDAQPTLARADALAVRLNATKAITPAHPAGLSEREIEVLRLVAAGRSNQDIADALFLSAHTVRHHLTHILAKTDTANRAEAVAFALRHGLA